MSDDPVVPRFNCVILASAHAVYFDSKAAPFEQDEKSLWYLVDDSSDYYALYKETSLRDKMEVKDGRYLAQFDSHSYPVGVFHKEEYRWSCERDCIVIEYAALELTAVNLRCNGTEGIERFIDHLAEQAGKITDNQLRAYINEVEDIETETYDTNYGIEARSVTTPEQKHWTRRIYAILVKEAEARRLLVRLQKRGLVHLKF